jgi:hypothetical protein
VRTNNHVERANRKLRFDEKVRYKFRARRSLDRFLRLRLDVLARQPLTGGPPAADPRVQYQPSVPRAVVLLDAPSVGRRAEATGFTPPDGRGVLV